MTFFAARKTNKFSVPFNVILCPSLNFYRLFYKSTPNYKEFTNPWEWVSQTFLCENSSMYRPLVQKLR